MVLLSWQNGPVALIAFMLLPCAADGLRLKFVGSVIVPATYADSAPGHAASPRNAFTRYGSNSGCPNSHRL